MNRTDKSMKVLEFMYAPHTRSLLSVFEEDAGTLTEYTNQLLQAMQRVYGAQNEMCLATQQLSKQLLAYEKQLNILHSELAKQLADTMVLPIIQFREKDLTEVSTLKDLFGLASNEHDVSMAKYSRLPKRKENEKLKAEVAKEVANARRKQHLSSLQYYCALNALQYRKRVAMMEPMLGYTRGQWICAINNISRQIYLTDNPEAAAIKLNQTALQAVTPITSLGKKHEVQHPSQTVKNTANDKIIPSESAGIQDSTQLIAPGTPIQFDIVLPAMEFLDQNRGGRRANPFGESEDSSKDEEEDSLLQQMFVVRFLGSMAVQSDETCEVIYEAMRQVLAARAIHNIFRMTESHLMVTSKNLRLIDPQTQVTRASFELTTVTQFAAHQENRRLIGFVIHLSETLGEESMSAYVFESNTEGEKICYAISLGKEITEAQKDPEALAQLMKSVPLTNDGKFMLLNDVSEEDGTMHEGGEESEA
ncbi:hypothetical protein IHE44_0012337 [Lamprotornis superbus]|uniref:PID domain-containing protein n=1 Tax=Lamprotornis superbus TaxID=245042 RepID=A0A835NSZ6_9PASS|nr:hypothetical protein IHE44_0012337 [Lamprotornis superbus]